MISNFHISKHSDELFYLKCHHSVLEALLTSLKKYAVFSKVSICEERELAIFTIDDSVSPPSNDAYTCLPLTNNKYEVWCTAAQLLNNFSTCSRVALTAIDETYNEQHDIERGCALVTHTHVEALMPSEINLADSGGVSFKKGCYTGQEVIARLHYKGNIKKHLLLARVSTEQPLNIGDKLSVAGQNHGEIINLAPKDDHGKSLCLILIADAIQDQHQEFEVEDSNVNIEWLPLPYAITK